MIKLYNKFGAELTQNYKLYKELSEKYGVKDSEIVQIDLNRSGIYLPNNEVREDFRVRFKGQILDDYESWFALPVRGSEDTPFRNTDNRVYFNNQEIGISHELMLDTCESSYQRGPNLLNLNSRSRSNCGGCKACVHNYNNLYDSTVIKDNVPLKTEEDLEKFFDEKNIDVSKLKQIAVVTGLFGGEKNVIEHMKLVNEVATRRGFKGEIMYFGCEVNSEQGLDELAKIDNFSIIYALDNFTKRESLLTKTKSLITLDTAKNTLINAKNRNINTTIAYISGIDSIEAMKEGFIKLKEALTRFPVINIYQIQTLNQANIMDETAQKLEFYVKSRAELEKIFKDSEYRPKRWENYRPLWYKTFADEELPNNSYGQLEEVKVKKIIK